MINISEIVAKTEAVELLYFYDSLQTQQKSHRCITDYRLYNGGFSSAHLKLSLENSLFQKIPK